MLTGCEQENHYTVFPTNAEGDAKGNPLYKASEKSSCCIRQFCSPECRPFQVIISNINNQNDDADPVPFLKIDRPCACTCYCFGRPEVKLYWIEDGKEELLGKVIDPLNCCNLFVDVYNKEGEKKYRINGSCCQLGLHCKLPCEPCQTIDFDVQNPGGDTLSHLQKRSPGCCQAAVSDTANFSITFPQEATKEDKALIMAAVIFMDYRFFEEKPKQHQDSVL